MGESGSRVAGTRRWRRPDRTRGGARGWPIQSATLSVPPCRGATLDASKARIGHPSKEGEYVNPRRVVSAVAAVWVCGVAAGQELNNKIEAAAANYKLVGARIGVSIQALDSGRTLADVHSAEGFTPASNMKLLTSGAALIVLGKDFVFKTELVMDGTRLVIRGSGDPALGDPAILEHSGGTGEKMTVDGLIGTLAEAVKKAG